MTDQTAADTKPTNQPTALIELRRARGEIARLRPFVAVADGASHAADHWETAAKQYEQERDGAYRERAHLVALLAAMTDGAVITYARDVEEPGWQIVYLTIGGQQASWHISPRDADLFAYVERVEVEDPRAQWDGHTTETKYERIAEHTAALMQHCGPECAEMHRGGARCMAGRS